MPTYTYKCKECGHQFDARQKFSDDALTDCPVCEGRLRRLVNNSGGIVFKGSGFYINDSKSGGKSKSSSVPPSAKSSENGDSSKGESGSSSEDKPKKSADKPKEKSNSPS